jgi:hypothetical protein
MLACRDGLAARRSTESLVYMHVRIPRSQRVIAVVTGFLMILAVVSANSALADDPTYPTRNGPKTESELQTELSEAGYPGPWDLASELNAYDRAAASATSSPAAPSVAPAPTQQAPSPAQVTSSDAQVEWVAINLGFWRPPPGMTDPNQLAASARKYVRLEQSICYENVVRGPDGQPQWYNMPFSLQDHCRLALSVTP